MSMSSWNSRWYTALVIIFMSRWALTVECRRVSRERLVSTLRSGHRRQTRCKGLLKWNDQLGRCKFSQRRKVLAHAEGLLVVIDRKIAQIQQLFRHRNTSENPLLGLTRRVVLVDVSV